MNKRQLILIRSKKGFIKCDVLVSFKPGAYSQLITFVSKYTSCVLETYQTELIFPFFVLLTFSVVFV